MNNTGRGYNGRGRGARGKTAGAKESHVKRREITRGVYRHTAGVLRISGSAAVRRLLKECGGRQRPQPSKNKKLRDLNLRQ